jgi:hypothetical protein
MCIIDVLVTNVAMPSIAASLHASGASLQLIVFPPRSPQAPRSSVQTPTRPSARGEPPVIA